MHRNICASALSRALIICVYASDKAGVPAAIRLVGIFERRRSDASTRHVELQSVGMRSDRAYEKEEGEVGIFCEWMGSGFDE